MYCYWRSFYFFPPKKDSVSSSLEESHNGDEHGEHSEYHDSESSPLQKEIRRTVDNVEVDNEELDNGEMGEDEVSFFLEMFL